MTQHDIEKQARAAEEPKGSGTGGTGRGWLFALSSRDDFIRILVLLLLIAIFAVVTRGATIGAENLANVLVQSSIRGIAACGQALIVLTGGLDLSVSGVVALSLMIGGSLITENPQFSLLGIAIHPLLGMVAMILIGIGFGAVSGTLVARFRLPALIVTLGMWQIGIGIAYQVTAGGFVDKLPQSIEFIGQGSFLYIPNPVILFFAVVAVSYVLLHRSAFGAEIYAVGGNPRTAFISGVEVVRVRIAVFAIAGGFYAIGAIVSMSRYMSATLAQTTGLELSTIAAVAIGGVSLSGGKGSILGVLLGTLIIGVIDNGLSVAGVGPAYQAILKGSIVIAAVMLDGFTRR